MVLLSLHADMMLCYSIITTYSQLAVWCILIRGLAAKLLPPHYATYNTVFFIELSFTFYVMTSWYMLLCCAMICFVVITIHCYCIT